MTASARLRPPVAERLDRVSEVLLGDVMIAALQPEAARRSVSPDCPGGGRRRPLHTPEHPFRLDFFGDTLESIRTFDAETQRTLLDMRALDLVPVSEFQLVTETIRRFRMGYVATFGAPERDDLLYEAVSEGRRFAAR